MDVRSRWCPFRRCRTRTAPCSSCWQTPIIDLRKALDPIAESTPIVEDITDESNAHNRNMDDGASVCARVGEREPPECNVLFDRMQHPG